MMPLAKVAVFGCLLATPGAAAALFNVTQVTMTTGCGSNPPIISADGQRLAFGSGCTLAGAPANPVGDFFVVDIATAAFTPITNTQNCFNGALVMSADGQRLAFTSACDLTGTNARHQSFLYAYDIAAGMLRQISTVAGCVLGSLTIDGDGSRIAFTTTCHPTQASDSTPGIYLYDAGADAVTAAVPSSGCSAGFHMAPAISADWERIAFASNCDLLDNADHGSNPSVVGALQSRRAQRRWIRSRSVSPPAGRGRPAVLARTRGRSAAGGRRPSAVSPSRACGTGWCASTSRPFWPRRERGGGEGLPRFVERELRES
jgi:hypothetical protein